MQNLSAWNLLPGKISFFSTEGKRVFSLFFFKALFYIFAFQKGYNNNYCYIPRLSLN